jgi:hypothetical protein
MTERELVSSVRPVGQRALNEVLTYGPYESSLVDSISAYGR